MSTNYLIFPSNDRAWFVLPWVWAGIKRLHSMKNRKMHEGQHPSTSHKKRAAFCLLSPGSLVLGKSCRRVVRCASSLWRRPLGEELRPPASRRGTEPSWKADPPGPGKPGEEADSLTGRWATGTQPNRSWVPAPQKRVIVLGEFVMQQQ